MYQVSIVHTAAISRFGGSECHHIAIVFKPFDLLAPIDLNYLVFKSFDFEHT
jgi:hypothetical protein